MVKSLVTLYLRMWFYLLPYIYSIYEYLVFNQFAAIEDKSKEKKYVNLALDRKEICHIVRIEI